MIGARVIWGVDKDTALIMYKSYNRSIIDYMANFYGSTSCTLLKQLDVILTKLASSQIR